MVTLAARWPALGIAFSGALPEISGAALANTWPLLRALCSHTPVRAAHLLAHKCERVSIPLQRTAHNTEELNNFLLA